VLQNFTVGDVRERRCEDVRHGIRVAGRHVLEDPREEIVARKYAHAISVIDRRGVHTAPRFRAIDHVVVNQRADVDQFHVCRECQVLARVGAVRFRRKQREARPKALSPGREHTSNRLGNERVVGRERVLEKILDERVEVTIALGTRADGLRAVDHAVPTWAAIAPPPRRT
jgi:hypothetical protein